MTDASFADGDPKTDRLALRADDDEGLAIISMLLQDAVGKTVDTAWLPKRRVFALMLNRFCWERCGEGEDGVRCRCGLHAENVLAVRATGFDPARAQQAFELLSIAFEPGEDGTGTIYLHCAGGAGFALDVEALDLRMADLDETWKAGTKPRHDGTEEGA